MKWQSWSEWNEQYTTLLKKRNKLERELSRDWNMPADKRSKIEAKLGEVNASINAHKEHPERPESAVMVNSSRKWI